jgi:hypothetical protein
VNLSKVPGFRRPESNAPGELTDFIPAVVIRFDGPISQTRSDDLDVGFTDRLTTRIDDGARH